MTTLYAGENPMFQALFGALNNTADEFAKLSAELEAATGNRDAAIQGLMETSDDEEMTKLREAIARATEKLRSLAESKVTVTEMSPEDVEKAKEKISSLKKNLRDGSQAIEKLTTLPEIYVDDTVKESVEKLKKLVGARTSSGTGNAPGTGIPKARVSVTVQGGNFTEPKPFPNLSSVAQLFKMESVDLLKAYADAAGVEFQKVSSVKTVTTFTIKPNENGSEYTLVVTPKTSAKETDKTEESAETPAVGNTDAAVDGVPTQETDAA